ncbi:MAG: DUF362 domain-containing protein [Anaerolineae bacterium]|nr:DUF362 domain-containing protein [Anaerolineae bacterium]
MSSKFKSRFTRRDFLKLALALSGGILGGAAALRLRIPPQPRANVTVFRADAYDETLLLDLIHRGLQAYPAVLARAKGGRVVLKPNLIEYYESSRVNTNRAVVRAAIEAFRRAGAAEVIVAEGPGHRRDMEILLELSGFDQMLQDAGVKFIDLNLDAITPVSLIANYTRLDHIFFPDTILQADLVVSMPKLKTHHWAGVTLSLKNMFGTVPGVKYGWPKNLLHWRGIHQSIADINSTLQPGFTIIDGIEGMEGDGPLYGDTVNANILLMGDNLTATDATAARLMGVYPERIRYFLLMLAHGGTLQESLITQLAENPATLQQDFRVLEHLAVIKKPPTILSRLFT